MDRTTKTWFDAKAVRLNCHDGLGAWMTDEQWIRLSGAPSNSVVTVSVNSSHQVELKVENSVILAEPMIRLIIQEVGGYAFYIRNAAFVLNGNHMGKHLGARSICMEIQQAKELGFFSKIQTHAVGNWGAFHGKEPLRGYYIWPMMGFDARLPLSLLAHPAFPPTLRHCQTLLELLKSEAGEVFWLENGDSLLVEFDLKDGSESWIRLSHYMKQRNIEVLP
jgi:hypothetical protein